jgi:hypothetical protein
VICVLRGGVGDDAAKTVHVDVCYAASVGDLPVSVIYIYGRLA